MRLKPLQNLNFAHKNLKVITYIDNARLELTSAEQEFRFMKI